MNRNEKKLNAELRFVTQHKFLFELSDDMSAFNQST